MKKDSIDWSLFGLQLGQEISHRVNGVTRGVGMTIYRPKGDPSTVLGSQIMFPVTDHRPVVMTARIQNPQIATIMGLMRLGDDCAPLDCHDLVFCGLKFRCTESGLVMITSDTSYMRVQPGWDIVVGVPDHGDLGIQLVVQKGGRMASLEEIRKALPEGEKHWRIHSKGSPNPLGIYEYALKGDIQQVTNRSAAKVYSSVEDLMIDVGGNAHLMQIKDKTPTSVLEGRIGRLAYHGGLWAEERNEKLDIDGLIELLLDQYLESENDIEC